MKVRVAITGPLLILRKKAIEWIEEKTNARYTNRITRQTTYLVASRMDTNKAKRAVAFGIPIISEKEMMSFIEKRAFPEQAQLTIWSCSVDVGISGLLNNGELLSIKRSNKD